MHVIFEPLDNNAWSDVEPPQAGPMGGGQDARSTSLPYLAALMPKPGVNLTRCPGVFAPNSKYRARVTPARRGRAGQPATTADPAAPTPAERGASMSLERSA